MNPDQAQFFESYVPVYDVVPEAWEDARAFITEQLKKLSNAVNVREIGWFLDEELLSGKQFIPSNATAIIQGTAPQFRTVLRKVIDWGILDKSGGAGPYPYTTTLPHDITFDANFTLIDSWLSATDPTNLVAFTTAFNPSADVFNVSMFITSTQVVVTINSNRTSYTRTFITIEYIQEL